MVFSYSSLEMIVKEKLLWEEGMGWNDIKVLSRNIPFYFLITEKNIHYIHEMKSQFLNSILILRKDKCKRKYSIIIIIISILF